MNKKTFLIIGFIVVIFVVIIAWWGLHLSLSPSTAPAVSINTISTNQVAATSSSASSSENIWGQYDISEPNTLMLVDSQGRRTGKDPMTGRIYREIPNTRYDVDISKPNHPVGELFISNLSAGQYTLYVLGGATGSYGVNIANNNGNQVLTGNVQKGSMIAYIQSYDPDNLPSSTFTVSSTVSSTASITTVPPDNWTPPAGP